MLRGMLYKRCVDCHAQGGERANPPTSALDPQPARHAGLSFAAFQPQAAEMGADEDFLHTVAHIPDLYDLQYYKIREL